MEDPPDTSDGVQPEEPPPTCTLPCVFDLTKNGEECLLKTNPLEALHAVQPSGWYLSSGTTNGMVLPEKQLDPLLPPSEQIQPDNALSNTTVTLSYVTRSHVFDGNASSLQHPQIYTIPLSKAISLHPAVYDDAQLVGSSPGPSLCVDMGQPFLQPVSMPVGLAACANPFDFVSPAQVVENVASLCYLQQAHDMSGLRNMESLTLEALRSLQQGDPGECKIPINLGDIQNGLWSAGSFDGSFPALPEGKNINPELVFLISRTGESTGLVVPLSQELLNALDHSRLPPVALVNGSKDHQTGPSSPEDLLVEETENTTQDELSDKDKITDVSTTKNKSNEQNGNSSPEELAQTEYKTVRGKGTQSPLGSLGRRALPPRSTRGMRLEAIVQNIYPTRFKSVHTPSSKKSRTDQTANRGATPDVLLASNKHSALEEECCETAINKDDKAARLLEKEEDTDGTESSQISTSSSESVPKHSLPCPSSGTLHVPATFAKNSKYQLGKSLSEENEAAPPLPKCSPKSTSHKSSPSVNAHGGGSLVKTVKKVNKAKTVCSPKSKKKKHTPKKLSAFPPQEPEINLRYLMCKHGRKEKRDETFTPFVHLDLHAGSTCTVINYPEESNSLSRGKQHQASQASGKIPSVAFVQYGRISSEGACPVSLVCCLCGGAANAMDLGDLHGPYYSEGLGPKDSPLSIVQESREDDSTDSDSLGPAGPSALAQVRKPRSRPQRAPPGILQRLGCDLKLSSSPAAKRSRTDGVVDWYTPPVVPVHKSEFWLHEDCGIWSAGVFLVKGKLYGLENAVKVANQTVCSCCQKPGASLGCFFKNCPNKYHYLCAVQSGCVLNAENFSMKCRKHKNKSIKAVSPHKPSDR